MKAKPTKYTLYSYVEGEARRDMFDAVDFNNVLWSWGSLLGPYLHALDVDKLNELLNNSLFVYVFDSYGFRTWRATR